MAQEFNVPDLSIYEYYILVALLEAPRHGIGIFEHVARRTNSSIILIPGTLYTALKRMYSAGWIELNNSSEINNQNGRRSNTRTDDRRKTYQLTSLGQQKIEMYVAWMEYELSKVKDDLLKCKQKVDEQNSQKISPVGSITNFLEAEEP